MKRCCQILTFSIVIISSAKASDLRGNINLSYQGTDGGSGGPYRSSFSQVANFYTSDRIFYSNDLTLGAFIFHSKANQSKADFRIRYSLNMLGNGYSVYSSYSPYTLYRGSTAQKFRVFQSSLSLKPAILPAVTTSYAFTKQYTTDHPRSQSGSSYQWNTGTQLAKSFGAFRGVYQQQQVKSEGSHISQEQVTKSVNLGYDIAKEFPAKISWSGDYNFIDTRSEVPGKLKDDSRTHLASFQAARNIGKWLSVSTSTSGRILDFHHDSKLTRIEDIVANGLASMRLREDLSFVILRGYSLSQSKNDTTTKTINSFVNFGALWNFPVSSAASSRLAFSRSVYYKSVLGNNTVDNGSLIIDSELYRRTSATLNLGAARSRKTASGYGRYQMMRSLDIVSRPVNTMSVNINYQSSQVSNKINFKNRISDNFSVNATHVLKYYFNYTITYTLSTYLAPSKTTVSTISLAANYRLSSALSLLGTYSRRDLGASGAELGGGIDQSATGRVSWMMSARSNLTLNYSISNINTSRQSQGFGGFYATSF
jgi:hypothetical protein